MDNRELAHKEYLQLENNPHKTDREKVVHEALMHVGYTEGENNDNRFGSYFEFNNVAWCGFFCNYCYVIGAGIYLPDTNKGKQGLAYVPKALSIFDEAKCLTAAPEMGDLVMFDFPNGVSADHIGIFHKWADAKHENFYAIEGNTSQKGHQSNGGAVEYQLRNIKLVRAYASLEKIKALKLQP